MSELKEFRLPDAGEGLTEAEIVSWHVKPGDTVEDGQIIVEIETAKAVVELPSPWDGTVARLLAQEGQTVEVGVPIITIDVGGTPGAQASTPAQSPAEAGGLAQESTAEPAAAPERQPVLVGYGVRTAPTTRRPRRPGRGPAAPAAPVPAGTGPARTPPAAPAATAPAAGLAPPARPETAELPTGPEVPVAPPEIPAEPPGAAGTRPLAKPPVRRLAKDLGISLAQLTGSGPEGSITRDDVQRAATDSPARSASDLAGHQVRPASAPAAASPVGEERIEVRGVRKHMAAAMVSSAFSAPHVTEFLQVDVTGTMAATARVRDLPEFAGLRVSPLLLVARALLVAAARHPLINSSWDEQAGQIVVKHYVNLGIAVAADRGLIVPNIKDAGRLDLAGLARGLQDLTETARAGKATPADLAGGTITITNVGVFGVDAGTPILTPGESAILAFGQIRQAPWVVGGELAVRQVCTLSLSFDHRVVDGELGSAVLRDVGAMLEDPLRMLAWS